MRARAISPGLNGKRVTKRSSRHTQNSVASLRAEIRDTGKNLYTYCGLRHDAL